MLNIEHKEDSTAKLEAVQGKPSKNFLFAEEVNQIVEEVNSIGSALNPDRIISLGTETIVGNEYTYEGYTWQLGGVQINNIGNPIQIVLPSATTGFKRNDISVFKSDGTIERIAGIETDGEIVSPPDVPDGTLYFKTYFIDGNVVESEPEPPTIDGSIFKKKSENSSLKITASFDDIIINLSLGGQMHYIVTSPDLTSVLGFSPHLLNMGGNPLYPGQDLIFENQTGNPVTLINAHSFAPIKFNEGADIIVPNGGKIWFRINGGFAELMMKSWSEVDLSTKADLVGGKVPESQLPSYVVNDITGLQTALDGKQNLLSSFDESILIENDGNIEGNVSLFEEYFEQQECELNFTPIQIIGVYLNGIKQKPSLYTIIPPKTISVTNFVANDYIEIQYTKLKI